MSVERGSESAGKSIFGNISKTTAFITFILGCVAFVPFAIIEAHKQKLDMAAAIGFLYESGTYICNGKMYQYSSLVDPSSNMTEEYSPRDIRLLSDFYTKCHSDFTDGWSWDDKRIAAETKIIAGGLSRDLIQEFSRITHEWLADEGGISLDQVSHVIGKDVEKVYAQRMYLPPYIMMFILGQIIAVAFVSISRMNR